MNIRPKILLTYGRINQPIQIPLVDLTANAINNVLSADVAAGSSTLTVKSIADFATAGATGNGRNVILLLQSTTGLGSELVLTSASVSPTGSTITLASATLMPHSSSSAVMIVPYNQVEISTSPTATGTKTVLTTIPIVVDNDTTNYTDTTLGAGFYFARFYNTLTSVFSSYSDPAPLNGYTIMSARSIIDSALGMINKKTSSILTDDFAFREIDNCQMECLREFKRWSFMQSFNTIIGQVQTGGWKVALPIDCDDQNTTKSVYNFRIGKQDPMIWVDKEEWSYVTDAMAYSTLASALSVGDLVINLVNSGDFGTSGAVRIGANVIPYTANNTTLNQLTIAASLYAGTIGQDVFKEASTGEPTYFTVYGGYLWHWPIASATYNGRSYFLDYYKSLVSIQHDSDYVVLPDPTVIQYFLAWKMLLRLNNGEETEGSTSMNGKYITRRDMMKKKESLNRNFILNPNVDTGYPPL